MRPSKLMDHNQSTNLMAVEKYLLEELTPEQRDEFEEHFFDCQECAADLSATQAFLQAAKQELQAAPMPAAAASPADNTSPRSPKKSLFSFFRIPAFTVPAFAALLLVLAYQNIVVFPHLASEVAELKAPQVLATLSLAAGSSRDGETPSITVGRRQALVINLDLPAQDRFASYTCLLYSPSGSTAFRIQVSAQQAKDTVAINVPPGTVTGGSYTLAVQGNDNHAPAAAAIEVAHYRFAVNIAN